MTILRRNGPIWHGSVHHWRSARLESVRARSYLSSPHSLTPRLRSLAIARARSLELTQILVNIFPQLSLSYSRSPPLCRRTRFQLLQTQLRSPATSPSRLSWKRSTRPIGISSRSSNIVGGTGDSRDPWEVCSLRESLSLARSHLSEATFDGQRFRSRS